MGKFVNLGTMIVDVSKVDALDFENGIIVVNGAKLDASEQQMFDLLEAMKSFYLPKVNVTK